MAEITILDSDYTNVKATSVSIEITGGWDLTDLKNEDEVVEYDNIKQTYYCSSHWTNEEKNKRKITISGRANNDGEIEVNIYGLDAGEENIIKFEINYSYEVREWDEDIGDWGDWETKSNRNPRTAQLSVYTRNNAIYTNFWKDGTVNISSGKYIDEHITTDNVEEWLEQLRIWKSWHEQEDYYDSYTSTSYTVDSGDDITATWYNRCVGACGLGNDYKVTGLSNVSVPADATYIAAEHFINLAKAVTDWT